MAPKKPLETLPQLPQTEHATWVRKGAYASLTIAAGALAHFAPCAPLYSLQALACPPPWPTARHVDHPEREPLERQASRILISTASTATASTAPMAATPFG